MLQKMPISHERIWTILLLLIMFITMAFAQFHVYKLSRLVLLLLKKHELAQPLMGRLSSKYATRKYNINTIN
jgi:hypothetical protein